MTVGVAALSEVGSEVDAQTLVLDNNLRLASLASVAIEDGSGVGLDGIEVPLQEQLACAAVSSTVETCPDASDAETISNLSSEQLELIASHIHIVPLAIKNLYGRSMTKQDLIAEGNIGLIKAAKRFDLSRGVQFNTFATVAIRGYVKNAIRDNDSMVRPKRSDYEQGKFIRTEPYEEETDGNDRLGDPLSQQPFDNVDNKLLCEQLLGRLEPMLRDILRCRNGLPPYGGIPHSQAETAVVFSISQLHVSRLERKAFSILRGANPSLQESTF